MAKIISDDALNLAIADFNKTMKSISSFNIPPINMPGLGTYMAVVIRTVEKGLTTSFEPFLKLVEIVKDIPKLPDTLKDFVNNFQEITKDPIGFIVKLMIEPISENFAMPIPSPGVIIGILSGTQKISEIDFDNPSNIIQTAPFSKLPSAEKNSILKLIKTIMPKMIEFLLLPAKIMINFFLGFVKLIVDALDPSKLPDFVSQWSNPVKGIMEMIGKIFGEVIGGVIGTFIPVDISSAIPKLISFITGLFTGESTISKFKKMVKEDKLFSLLSGFVGLFIGIIEWMKKFIIEFPKLFLS